MENDSYTTALDRDDACQSINNHLRSIQILYCLNSDVAVPDDFLVLTLSAMEHLKACARSNVVYNLAKVLGTKREDNSDTLLSVCRWD